MLQGVVDTQMESTAAAAAELMRAVLREADLQRLVLKVDSMAVLTNAGGVNAMGHHGRQLLSGPSSRLAPITMADAGGEAARQLAEANAEVRRLREKLHQVTDAYTKVMNSRSADTEHLLSMQEKMNDRERLAAELAVRCQGQDGNLQAAVHQLRTEVADAKRELATRLNQSTQYQQVKKLLAQRNDQIKDLRARLARFDPSFRASNDDIAPEKD
ncbi:hypothetical protein STCU_02060 [Strigomonas culicis]|uniref:Leucine zipper transcription factor-like protein 1 n=1 Tax=Strigomonas culicis TaxID=28005 RepID=S9W2Y8_9TRYP|nr:hypothetical protein STCU_02060 [Strigomonas culicis]|eukprot:EPY33706.1 hypothetical protein STCU_02060 [Strigomonas culicis]